MIDNSLGEFTGQLEGMGFGLIEFEGHKDGFLQFKGIDSQTADKVTLRVNISDFRVLVSYSSWNGRPYTNPSFVRVGSLKPNAISDITVAKIKS